MNTQLPQAPFDEAQVGAYLERIGLEPAAVRSSRPDLDLLRLLQRRHLHTVPFENLSIHLDETVPLTTGSLFEKIVTRRRGGYCYELNGCFGALLDSLGYRVRMLGARVHNGERFGPPISHALLRVDLEEAWLVDVGFGRPAQAPLRPADRGEQKDVVGVFRIAETDEGDLDVHRDGVPQYRVEQHPRALEDFRMSHWYQRTCPDSHFTQSVFCTVFTDAGLTTLAGRRLITTEGGERRERELPDDAAVFAAYREVFGVELDRLPAHP